jgi:hypothetical protein
MGKNRFILLGDLHFEVKTENAVNTAFELFKHLKPDFMVSLGDLGGYSHPGTQLSFDEAKTYFDKFNFPVYPLVGNHDLEGLEFKTDEANIKAWQDTFNLNCPYYSVKKDTAIFIFLSSTQFRENTYCCHEVYIDDTQFNWFKQTVHENKDKQIFVFSHAPIIGSGIRVLQNLHLRGGNAWLNHSQQPEKFIQLVNENPQIKFWASGHNHLSQEYPDTTSIKNGCLFCHTGVINNITRDGRHQSRLIELDDNQISISTIDHDSNTVKQMQTFNLRNNSLKTITPLETILDQKYVAPPPYESAHFVAEIGNSQFALAHGMIVEYLKNAKGPFGVLYDAHTSETQIKVSNQNLEIWENKNLIEIFKPTKLGTYSTLIGIRISEHKLKQG